MLESGAPAYAPDVFSVDEDRLGGGRVLLSVRGDADLHVAADLKDRLDDVIDDGATLVVLDLSATTFLDSMALGVLLAGLKRLRGRGGRLRVVAPGLEIRRIFGVTLLDRVFDLDDSREAALAATADGAGRNPP